MMPRPQSWHVPSPGHRPVGRPDPVEHLAVPVPTTAEDEDRTGSDDPTRPVQGEVPAVPRKH